LDNLDRRAFRDSNGGGKVSQPRVWMGCDRGQNMCMISQEFPWMF
jgi:hypothetical protein